MIDLNFEYKKIYEVYQIAYYTPPFLRKLCGGNMVLYYNFRDVSTGAYFILNPKISCKIYRCPTTVGTLSKKYFYSSGKAHRYGYLD